MAARSENLTLIGYPYARTPTTYSYKNVNIPYSAVSEANFFRDTNLELKSGDRILVDCQDIQGWATVKADGKSIRGGDNPLRKVPINGPDDFPQQNDTQLIIPPNYLYVNNNIWETDKEIFFNGGRLTGLGEFADNDPEIIYTGSGECLTATTADIIADNLTISAVNGGGVRRLGPSMGGRVLLTNVLITGCVTGMTIDNTSGVVLDLTGLRNVSGAYGIKCTGLNNIVFDLTKSSFTGLGAGDIGIDIRGLTSFDIKIISFICSAIFGNDAGCLPIVGDPSSANIVSSGRGVISACDFNNITTPLTDITQEDPRWTVSESPPIPNSTVKGKLRFADSILETTILSANTPTPINAIWSDGEIEERICFRDKVTFDNTTNTLTSVGGAIDDTGGSAFNHALSNGDEIILTENAGLPAELSEDTTYYVGDVTATTFRLYSDSGLTTLVTFTDDGTPQNYYDHFTGDSSSGWFVYIGDVPRSVSITGWITLQKASGSDAATRAVLMITDTSFNITEEAKGSTISAKNGIPLSSMIVDIVTRAKGEGFVVYEENIVGIVNNITPDAQVIVSLA